eukprot:g64823.t1
MYGYQQIHCYSGMHNQGLSPNMYVELLYRSMSGAMLCTIMILYRKPNTVRKQRGIMESTSQDIVAPGTTVNSYGFLLVDVPNSDDFVVFTSNSEMTEVINENHLQCGEVEQVSVNENLQQFTNSLNLYQIAQQTNDPEDMKRLVKEAMQALQVAFSQLKVMSTNLWVLWLMAWAPSSSVGLTVPEHKCIESFDLAFNNGGIANWILGAPYAIGQSLAVYPTECTKCNEGYVGLGFVTSKLVGEDSAHYVKSFSGGTFSKLARPSNLITWEIAKPDSRQVEGMVEVKEAVATSATGLGRPGIQTIYYQVLGEATVKAASVDRFEASAVLEALDRGSDSELAEAAAVKSQMARVCKKNESKGFGLFATNNWTSHAYECAEIIDVDTVQDCLHYTDCVSLERTLSTAGMQFYHPANILFVDGTGLKGGKSAYRSISFLPQQFIRYVNSSQDANATYQFFHKGVMLKSMRQNLVKCGLTQETLESILCKDLSDSGEHVSLAGKLVEVFRRGKWEVKIVALRKIRRGEEITFDYQQELADLLRKESTPGIHALNLKCVEDVTRSRELCLCYRRGGMVEPRVSRSSTALSASVSSLLLLSAAAVSVTDSSKSVRLTMINSSSTRGSSSLDVARPKNAPSSSSASSSSRVGRQKTAPLSTSVSSFSKIVMQKKAPSSTSASSFATVALQKKAPSSTSASSFATVALQKKAASSRTSRSAPDNLSQAKRADILSQPWLCDQKTLLVSVLTKYPFLDNKSKASIHHLARWLQKRCQFPRH